MISQKLQYQENMAILSNVLYFIFSEKRMSWVKTDKKNFREKSCPFPQNEHLLNENVQ